MPIPVRVSLLIRSLKWFVWLVKLRARVHSLRVRVLIIHIVFALSLRLSCCIHSSIIIFVSVVILELHIIYTNKKRGTITDTSLIILYCVIVDCYCIHSIREYIHSHNAQHTPNHTAYKCSHRSLGTWSCHSTCAVHRTTHSIQR